MGSELKSTDSVERAPRLIALTLAVAVVAFGWAKLTTLPWKPVMVAAPLFTLLWMARSAPRKAFAPASWLRSRATLVGFGGLLLLWGLRFYPMMGALAPPGGDMSMHTLLTRIATEHPILPATQSPLYPGVPYGVYPLGFHALAALVSGSPEHVGLGSRILIALSQVVFALGVYVVLRSRTSRWLALLSAGAAVLIFRNPQGYVGWGGNPCVLGFGFGILAWQVTNEYLHHPTGPRGGLAATLIAATALTHPTAALTLAIALAITVAVAIITNPSTRVLRAAVFAGLCGLVLAAPILVEVWNAEYSDGEMAWVAANHLGPPQSPPLAADLLPDYWGYAFGDAALAFAVLGLLILAIRRRWREGLGLVAFITAMPYVVIWYRHSGLPASLSLYPERVLLVLVVPLAILVSHVLGAAAELLRAVHPRWRMAQRGLGFVLGVGVLVTAGLNYHNYYFRSARSSVRVTDVDARAFDEIRAVATETSLVSNQVADAAAFLPGLWGVASTHPQYNPVWKDELDLSVARREPDFVYCRGGRARCDSLPEQALGAVQSVRRYTAVGDTVTVWHLTPAKATGDAAPGAAATRQTGADG